MNATEEIIVSGKNFIERRIILFSQQENINVLRMQAFNRGYKCGWIRGLVIGLAVAAIAALCIWLTIFFD